MGRANFLENATSVKRYTTWFHSLLMSPKILKVFSTLVGGP